MQLGRPVARHHVRRPHEEIAADPGPPDAADRMAGGATPDQTPEPAHRGPEQRPATTHR